MDNELLAAIGELLEPIKQSLTEHTQLLRALEHASEIHKAGIDNITYDIAEIKGEVKKLNEGQARLEAGVGGAKAAQREFYEMYGDHETQIRELRRKVASS